jgi:hypothetical protein
MNFHRINIDSQSTAIDSQGDFCTTDTGAEIQYNFDTDDTVKLTINGQWFSNQDLNELISFLQFVKTQFKE